MSEKIKKNKISKKCLWKIRKIIFHLSSLEICLTNGIFRMIFHQNKLPVSWFWVWFYCCWKAEINLQIGLNIDLLWDLSTLKLCFRTLKMKKHVFFRNCSFNVFEKFKRLLYVTVKNPGILNIINESITKLQNQIEFRDLCLNFINWDLLKVVNRLKMSCKNKNSKILLLKI